MSLLLYPLGAKGKIIGTPFVGTHATAFNRAGGSDNWESERAVDIGVPVGTPVRAVSDGVIGNAIGSLGSGGRFAGLRLHLLGGGNEYYYAHLSKLSVHAGQKVKAGDILGYSGSANGVAHLHFAQKTGDPQQTISGAPAKGLSVDLAAYRKAYGHDPPSSSSYAGRPATGIGGSGGSSPQAIETALITKALNAALGGLWDAVGKDGTRALLYVVLVGAGVALALSGASRALGGAPGRAVKAATSHVPIPVPV